MKQLPNLETRKPGTVRSYLTSLNLFLTFKKENHELPTECRQSPQMCLTLSRNRRRVAAERQADVRTNSAANLLPASAVAGFKKTSYYCSAMPTILDGSFHKSTVLYNATRDLVLTLLLLTSGQRVSALSAMTVGNALSPASSLILRIQYHTVTVSINLD